ncbi:MAG: alpha/beta fold hydrolase [Myxococcota bacterium]|nr:alpha/beta fold hydrolase [Myxococcota bacterium]
MNERKDVAFEGHGGTLLRGWLYLPRGDAEVPGVVMAHGLSAVKEMALDRFAEALCDAGMTVLVYDHRNLGASDGEPRQQINPWAQARDYRHAITWLSDQPRTDADRIAIWGSSYSGGEVIVVGACDDRVKAVIANVPFAGYAEADYSDTAKHYAAIREQLYDESGTSLADTQHTLMGPIPVIQSEGIEGPVILDQPESTEWFGEAGSRAPNWFNSVALENAAGTEPAWDPGACIAHVAPRPLLLVVATEDRLAEAAVTCAAFERAGEPKELVMIDGHHFNPYEGEAFEHAAVAMRDFLKRHLESA